MSQLRQPERTETATEDIHLRNYDAGSSHLVWVQVLDDGDQVIETTCRLRPGEAHSITDAVPPGEYDIAVGVDGRRRERSRCRIGDGPERTSLVEMGNGVVSITEGVH